ncbi:DUF2482 family protein, partial [Staphylococcus aureus]
MTKKYKDTTQAEVRGVLAEKNAELINLANEIDEETEDDVI